MSLLKDFKQEVAGQRLQSKVKDFLSPSVWLRLQKYRTQRADRGWSDRDCWDMGNRVIQVTCEMLEHLRDKGVTDWKIWFKNNIEDETYTHIQPIIDDLKAYLESEETSWADDLNISSGQTGKYHMSFTRNDIALTEEEITDLINVYYEEKSKLYLKAQEAMSFFSRNFASFWD